MDIFGTQRDITVSGVKTGTPTELRSFITSIEGIQDGKQTLVTYNGDLITTNKDCLIQSFTWSYSEGNPSSISYTLSLIEGEAI